jgi:hypothetical protein
MTPFGEDITNPDSRVIPPQFHGEWVRDLGDCGKPAGRNREIIEADRLIIGNTVERVVAVRFITPLQIAVVTRSGDGDGDYSLHYRGVSEDGAQLIDLENMDWVLNRCPGTTDRRQGG